MKKLDVFIKGDLIDLCVPTLDYAADSDWYNWFNDARLTRFLDQGLFPNTSEKQVDFLKSSRDNRIILVISYQQTYLGVVSLSSINWIKGWADIALVVNKYKVKKYDNLIPLEAIARLTEHAYTILNLKRISAGQHILLSSWQERLELLGYRLEGIKQEGFVKGSEVSNAVWIAATRRDYDTLVKNRGKYWDSAAKMRKRIEKLPKNSYYSKLEAFVSKEGRQHYDKIFKL